MSDGFTVPRHKLHCLQYPAWLQRPKQSEFPLRVKKHIFKVFLKVTKQSKTVWMEFSQETSQDSPNLKCPDLDQNLTSNQFERVKRWWKWSRRSRTSSRNKPQSFKTNKDQLDSNSNKIHLKSAQYRAGRHGGWNSLWQTFVGQMKMKSFSRIKDKF